MQSQSTAIIIGAGVAGLASAIRLAVNGFAVTVFEKNNHVGGKLYKLEQDGYCFDTGPSLFVQPENIEALFSIAGENIHKYLHYNKLNITCKYFYEDGTIINAYADRNKFIKEIQQQLKIDAANIDRYLNEAEKMYNAIGNIFLNHSLHKTKTWFNTSIIKALVATRLNYLFTTLHITNKKQLNHTKLVQLFDRYATYSGSNPYQAPGMLKLIPHLELNKGSFYAKGGMISINKALYKLALKKGVQFKLNAEVEKIIQKNNAATGIVVNGQSFYADVIVSNADVYFTYQKLLNHQSKADEILQQERSSSALIFYWGIKKEFPQLELHNIFFSKDYKAEFDSIFHSKQPYNDPTVYINITSKMEPGLHAPAGKENWFVMVNVPSDTNISKTSAIHLYKKNILAKLNRILHADIEPLIETESILHPQKIETDTGSYSGALYGTSSNSRNAAFLRHPNFSKQINRLYFAGGSVHPGGGIPLCLKSAAITTNLIMNDRKKWKHHE